LAKDSPERPGYSSFAAIPRDLRTRLSRAEESTRTLAEMLAIDFAIYLPIIEPRVSQADARACQEAGGITRKIAMAAEVLVRANGDAAADALARTLATHPTDLARGIAAYVVGVHASRAMAQLDTNDAKGAVGGGAKADKARRAIVTDALNAVRPLADDEHSGVREWAWMGIRPLLARDIAHTIKVLEPWTRDASSNIRRFATEATRPRGVWCAHIAALRADPSLGLPLLEPLKADPTKYVQDSVANWLNDASKDDEKFVRTLTTRWTKDAAKLSKSNPAAAKATARIITRALRTVGAVGG
jgi:3-methyladenine DNA glycosylase AlkC